METQLDSERDDLVFGLPSSEVFEKAKKARGIMGQASRALLFWVDEIERRQLFRELGYTSVFAFCELELSLDPHTISEMLRTCRCLRDLPALMRASAEIAPSKLREISRVCTLETEDFWIKMARTRTYREIEKLVASSPKGGIPPTGVVNRDSGPCEQKAPRLALASDSSTAVALPTALPEAPMMGDLLCLVDSALPEEEKPLVPSAVAQAGSGACPVLRHGVSLNDGVEFTPLQDGAGMTPALKPDNSASFRPPLKVRYKFIVDLEADAWAVLEEALRLAQKQSGKRDRAYLIRHLAECFLLGTRAGQEEVSASVAFAPYRVVIHEAPVQGVAWVEGPNGAHFVEKSKVEEAHCCGEILDLREAVLEAEENSASDSPSPPRPSGPRLRQAIPPSVRRLVVERDQGRCQAPGCRNRAFNHIHHIVFWSDGGSNNPGNLCLTCGCHRALHNGLLSAEGSAPDNLVWKNAKGRVISGTSSGQGMLWEASG